MGLRLDRAESVALTTGVTERDTHISFLLRPLNGSGVSLRWRDPTLVAWLRSIFLGKQSGDCIRPEKLARQQHVVFDTMLFGWEGQIYGSVSTGR